MKRLSGRQILILIIAFLLIGAGFLLYQRSFKTDYDAFEFIGRIEKIEDNSIFLFGTYFAPDQPDLANAQNQKKVKVMIGSETKFVKTKLFLPTDEELKASGGRFRPDELKREEETGSLDDIKKILENSERFSIRVKSTKDIYGKSKFYASEISYIVPIYP